MRYVIVTIEWCLEHGIVVPEHVRKNIEGTKVILHEDWLKPVLYREDEKQVESYLYDSEELNNILDSEEWNEKEE